MTKDKEQMTSAILLTEVRHPMNIQQLRQSLKQKWLIYYEQNISWLVKMRIWGTYDGLRRPLSGFILATLSVLEPQFDEILSFMLDLNNDPDKIVAALGLNFNPDQELRLIKSEHSIATSQVEIESLDKKLHPLVGEVFGHREWGLGHGEESQCPMPNAQCPMPNAQCPKSAGGYPSPPTREWSFPPTSDEDTSLVVTASKIAPYSLAKTLDSNLPRADQLVPLFIATTEVVRTRKPELVAAFGTKIAPDTPVKTPSFGLLGEYQPLRSGFAASRQASHSGQLPSKALLTVTTEFTSKAKTMPSVALAEVSRNVKTARSGFGFAASPSGRIPVGALLAITTEISSNGKPVRSLAITTEVKSNGKDVNMPPQDFKSKVNLTATNARSLASWVDEFCHGTRNKEEDIFL